MLNKNILPKHIYYYLTMQEKNIVGSRIREARKAAKPPVTQADLIARLQLQGIFIDQPALSKIETGKRPVLDIEVLAFAKALKVASCWLLGESDKPTHGKS
jgi:hypothetical protein